MSTGNTGLAVRPNEIRVNKVYKKRVISEKLTLSQTSLISRVYSLTQLKSIYTSKIRKNLQKKIETEEGVNMFSTTVLSQSKIEENDENETSC